ncbi:uncharacterized protein SPSK_10741 [Sporothrix schenckii 1099-18]|uniref:Uncharacterized protein n=1 Tax=Sporothrix schenckii 1099-18 TaxID=1397361 RepID=A0A0F2MDQ4_SPOSC|nr:uncharacterized protein SPSK_10741 [Sporothrix schenckii 1099-18]KJR87777.1 hypothetical protein SPSK_10741 [Sporothrix schenckii 1099-18]
MARTDAHAESSARSWRAWSSGASAGTVATSSRSGRPASRARCCTTTAKRPPADVPPMETRSGRTWSAAALART